MKTTAIKIEGQILSSEILDRIESAEIKGQSSTDYGLERSNKLKDIVALAWADAKDQWNIFKRRIEKIPEEESGTSETRKFWILPFLENLGYQISIKRAEIISHDPFAISHKADNLDEFPVHILGFQDSLDKKRETSGPRLSPHALLQEYLNRTEHDYGLVTNGYQLRLLRDSGKLIRLTYLEFDLFRMMEDDLYAEFSIMYRLIHSSRMPSKRNETESSIIEHYHLASLEAGSRIREKLSEAVEKSLIQLGNGFLGNINNQELRDKILSNELSSEQYFQYLLRFIYRLLFLMVIEERDIIYSNKIDEKTRRLRDIYYDNYSISRIRNLSEHFFLFDDKLQDVWISLRNTFRIFGNERLAQKLNIYPLDGDLFEQGAIGILDDCSLDNKTLLKCIKNLSVFENNQTKTTYRINYGGLNVEEFGSVYEGILEKAPFIEMKNQKLLFTFIKGTERSSSGSHYTPEELVQPLIKHSLDYVIEDKIKEAEKEGKKNPELLKELKEKNLLSIKVCDVACGSGHILLSAARRIATELTKVRTGEDQPSPEPYRHSIRDVINNCIYGVDKNPLAVELCKVALWLEAHNPGMPLNFLDHKIKCGDSIVGLAHIEELQKGIATEAFKNLPGDDNIIAATIRKQNKLERDNRKQLKLTDTEEIIKNLNTLYVKFRNFNLLPDNTVDEVKRKQQEFNLLKGSDWLKIKELADLQVAQFFIPKTEQFKELLTTDSEFFRIFAGQKKEVNTRKISTAMSIAAEKKFFHWFLEFPEVMQQGGFDCIVGNPPYLGDKKQKSVYGEEFLEYVKYLYKVGVNDLVVYFLNRIYSILKNNCYQSLLTTSSISQGDLRNGGLEKILQRQGSINFGIKSIKWLGEANLNVALTVIKKGKLTTENVILNGKTVKNISSFLSSELDMSDPIELKANENKMFTGYYFLGDGFLLNNLEAMEILKKDIKYKDVVYPFINGDDLNDSINQKHSRYIINFFDWPLNEEYDSSLKHPKGKPYASDYPICLNRIQELVKPERHRWKIDKNGNEIVGKFALDNTYREKWWQFARSRPELRKASKNLKHFFITAQTTKYLNFVRILSSNAVSQSAYIFVSDKFSEFVLLQNSFHLEWAQKYGNTKGDTFRYAPSKTFENYPFPTLKGENEKILARIGEEYHEFRRLLMNDLQKGLTKTFNLFHDPLCNSINIEKAKKIKELNQANLIISIEEAMEKIEKLRELHKQMDEIVLKAYGWEDINLAHDFYEVDYLPENDRVRYTISPEARKEVLKRLLDLNHKIHEEEVAAGLWDKKKTKSKQKDTELDKKQEELFE